jgi:disulfide bond formation protein DsbB
MLERILTALSANTIEFWTYSLGVGLVLFALIWGGLVVWGIVRKREGHHGWTSGILIALAVLVGLGAFAYLTASTPFRRAYVNLPMREMAIELIKEGLGLTLALSLATAIYALARRLGKRSDIAFGVTASLGIVLMFGIASWGLYRTTFNPDLDEITAAPSNVADIKIVDNIGVKVFEKAVADKPTALLVGPDKELYVAGIDGFIWVMWDDDQDGTADRVAEFAKGLKQPEGLVWSQEGLYVTTLDKLLLMTDTNGDYVADATKAIVDGFPGEQYAFHQANGLAWGPDGRLYIGVGSTTDHRPETHPLAAKILSINPDGSDLQVYATGLRNPFAIVPAPGGGFFAIDNGSSGCVDTAVKIDDCSNKIDVPEELNYVTQGNDYGFPNYFGIPPQDSGTMPPMVTFPDHGAPAGLALYQGSQLPAKFNGQLFISLFARNEIYSVRFHRLGDEHFTGASRLFASGLVGPSAIANSPSGGLYVASFTGGAIYYMGGTREQPLATPTPGVQSAPRPADAAAGQQLFLAICAACHGPTGEGMVGLGKDLTVSEFVVDKSDDELVVFVKKGREATDPLNTTGIAMPPLGGHPELTDQNLYDIVAYLRTIQK